MDELDPTKYHVLKPEQKPRLVLIAAVFLLVVMPFFSYYYYRFAVLRPAQGQKEAQFEIKSGEGISEIAANLSEGELINSEFLFKAYLFFNGLHRNIQAGIYKIPAGSSVVDLARLFQHGTQDIEITFIEGLRVEEFAREAAKKFNRIDYSDFLSLVKSHEGYLFPDTYFFDKDVTEQEMVDRLRETFGAKTESVLTPAALKQAGLSKDEAAILASIVEREVSKSEDRPIVAGILVKRWRNDQRLDADATTQYAVAEDKFCVPEACRDGSMGCNLKDFFDCPREGQMAEINWWPKYLTSYDLNFDSPFNTRRNIGLPPSPICNPSLDAINAVLNFQETPYNYYLTDSDGNTHYSMTLDEHNQNVQRYL